MINQTAGNTVRATQRETDSFADDGAGDARGEPHPVTAVRLPADRTLGLRRSTASDPAHLARELLTAAIYHRRTLALAFLVPVLLGLAAAAISKTAYTGDARLLVLYGSEFIYTRAAAPTAGGVALDRNEIMLGELQILQSEDLARETLQAVGVERVYPDLAADRPAAIDQAVARLSSDLAVSSIPQSNVITLGFRSRDPDVVVAVLSTLIEKYLARRASVFGHAALHDADAQRQTLRRQLDAADAALAAFARSQGISNLDQQINLLLQQSVTNAASQRETRAAISEAEAKLAAVRTQLAATPQRVEMFRDVERSQQAGLLTGTLTDLQSQLDSLRAHFGADAPQVREREGALRALRAQLAGVPARQGQVQRQGPNPVYVALQSQASSLAEDLQGWQARDASLRAAAAALAEPLARLTGAQQRYDALKRERDLLDETYRGFARNLDAAQASDALEPSPQANVRIVEPPLRPTAGHDPRALLAGSGVALGVLAAAAVLAVLSLTRPVLLTAYGAEQALGLPVLGVAGLRREARAGPVRRSVVAAWRSTGAGAGRRVL
jgi:uncharacterized protein involved in exopolysaccharide biosynthesis